MEITGKLRAGLAAFVAIGALAAAGGLAGCSRGDGQASASGAGLADKAYAGDRGGRGGGGGYGGGGYGDRADRGPVPLFHGEPMWSENRAHSAKENAEYHFERAGGDLGAKTLDDFLTKVHRFGDHPPAGTLKMNRPNGDRLLYDPKANLFAVFTREGAPRTVFKPNDGMAYWTEQKQRLARGDDGYRRRSYGGGGGEGERSGRSGEGE
jgi:hypothetical protein